MEGGMAMGIRVRRGINLEGGFKINLCKSGVGYGWGTKGVRNTKTATGKTETTLSFPGTKISQHLLPTTQEMEEMIWCGLNS
jgi:hypothetical protein